MQGWEGMALKANEGTVTRERLIPKGEPFAVLETERIC